MKSAIHYRVSSDDQANRGTIRNQKEFAETYCPRNDITIADFYLGDGVSGAIPLE